MKKLLIALSLIPAVSSADETLYGKWQGQVEFQVSMDGNLVPESHAVTDVVLSIDQRGKVVGESKENGCRILGLATPGPMPSILNVGLNLSGCNYPGLNERFNGLFSFYKKDGYAVLSLNGTRIKLGAPSKSFFMKGNFRY